MRLPVAYVCIATHVFAYSARLLMFVIAAMSVVGVGGGWARGRHSELRLGILTRV